jgi:hypothetical protein
MNIAGVNDLRIAIQNMANYSMINSTPSDPVIDVSTKQGYDFTV